jgi:DNA-binding ferritin-like protein
MHTRSHKRSHGLTKTRSNRGGEKKYSQQKIVIMFLKMLNTIKLYHWKTSSYAQHKATDELYTNVNASVDSFVETMLGKTGGRVNLTGVKHLPLMDYTNVSDFKKEVDTYKKFLIDMSDSMWKDNSDLMNIRDEILGFLNQFSYLLTFK